MTTQALDISKLGLAAPVEVKVPHSPSLKEGRGVGSAADSLRTTRVAAVVPCFNRKVDAQTLLDDLSKVVAPGVELRVLLVDNASTHPLSELPTPKGVHLTHLRLPANTGGSGGYNAGMTRALGLDREQPASILWAEFDAEFLWLVDSDARVGPDTLSALLKVMTDDPTIIAAGATICDPATGQAFELGGHVNRRNGNFEPMVTGAVGVRTSGDGLVECDYVAACCALVRASSVRSAGAGGTSVLFPDTFLNGDDVEWCIRLKQRTGGRVVGVPWALAMHPRFDRFPTWTRYYMARNALGPLQALGVARRVRMRRALLEVPRAVQQAMMGRRDLSSLHVRALKDAASGQNRGMAAPGVIAVDPLKPFGTLADTLRAQAGSSEGMRAVVHPLLAIDARERQALLDQLTTAGFEVSPPHGHGPGGVGFVRGIIGALKRWVLGPEASVAVVPSRGKPDAWFLGKANVQVSPGGYVLRGPGRIAHPINALGTLIQGTWHGVRAGWRTGDGPVGLNATAAAELAALDGASESLSLNVIVLSYNRWPALETTLKALLASPVLRKKDGRASRTITVVDNASTDGTPERVEEFFPGVTLMRMPINVGVEAFDAAVDRATEDAVLILDDDAIPDNASLAVALDRLARNPRLGGVTLHPIHPKTGLSEWSFAQAGREPDRRETEAAEARAPGLGGGRNDWPVMGCANLVRRSAWNSVGGYEKSFFLYRNDADLALKLLSAGWGVHFDPALTVMHDTPAGAGKAKSVRWHELATRNWIWMCKRHAGPGAMGAGLLGIALGWAWAHKLAGIGARRHVATLRGAITGIVRAAPPMNGVEPDGRALFRLLRLQTLKRS